MNGQVAAVGERKERQVGQKPQDANGMNLGNPGSAKKTRGDAPVPLIAIRILKTIARVLELTMRGVSTARPMAGHSG